jgi:chaperonin GroES
VIKPLHDIVVIRRSPPEERSEGGIYLAWDADFKEDIGVVHACGPGKVSPKGVFIPISVKKGQKVIFSTNGHQITRVNGEEFVVLREPSIIAVIDKGKS